MKPYYERQGIRLWHGDCLEWLAGLPPVDAVVTDPPYGIGEARGKNASRTNAAVAKDYGVSDWDDVPCSPEAIAEMRRVSRWQIIFGGNYFELPPSSCWLIWDKKTTGDFADCEMAWTNLPKAVRRIEWLWNGMIRKGDDIRVHPTQKPVGVMEWCLSHLPEGCNLICDPFAGSGTTGIACIRTDRRFVGCEREERYCEAAAKRFDAELDQGRLFTQPEPQPVQKTLMG